jgi:hypothetical protein
MTVSTQLSKITYNGDGATFQWSFSFPGHDPSAIVVFITDAAGNVVLQSTLTYTVTLIAPVDPNPTGIGGSVILNSHTPLPVGQKITIMRLLPEIQPTSIASQSIVYPPIVELEYDYLTMVDQQLQEQVNRSIQVAFSDPNPAPLPSVAQRAGLNAMFDSVGNLTAGAPIVGGVTVSAAMIPVVTAATIKAAQIAFGLGPFGYAALNGSKLFITNALTVTNGMKGLTLVLAGSALYTVTMPPPASIDDDFQILIFVNDSRGKDISVPGYPKPFMLWPGQWMILSKYSGTWLVMQPPRWKVSAGTTIPVYVNPASGNDNNDGLARGAGAFQTIQGAVNMVQQFTDGVFQIIPEAGFGHTVGAGVILDGLQFNRSVTIIGDGPVAPPGVSVTGDTGGTMFHATNGAILGLQNLYIGLNSPGSAGNGIVSENGSVVNLANCSFGGMTGVHMTVDENATLNVTGFYDIYGGATVHLYANASGYVSWAPSTVGINSAINIGTFVEAVYNSSVVCPAAINFANASFVTGKQFLIDYNSSLVTQGAVIPGTVAGTAGPHGGFVV